MRRAVALGVGLVALIIIVLGVKGCLDARAHRALEDYARNVSQILKETEQTSKKFFGNLEDPGTLSVTDFTNEVAADRSAMDNYATRIDGLSAPGEVGEAQKTLELVYELRASAMDVIANKMKSALGNEGAAKAQAAITRQMQSLLSSDVVYEKVVRPEINGSLEGNGISGSDVPKSTIVPGGIKWLEESSVQNALAGISGSSGAVSGGVHGLGLYAASVNGTELVSGGEAIVAAEEEFVVEVQVQNQGESTENGVTVEVAVNGGAATSTTIESIAAAEIETASIPVTPVPSGTVTLEVKVAPVPGEAVTENNEASYTVIVG